MAFEKGAICLIFQSDGEGEQRAGHAGLSEENGYSRMASPGEERP